MDDAALYETALTANALKLACEEIAELNRLHENQAKTIGELLDDKKLRIDNFKRLSAENVRLNAAVGRLIGGETITVTGPQLQNRIAEPNRYQALADAILNVLRRNKGSYFNVLDLLRFPLIGQFYDGIAVDRTHEYLKNMLDRLVSEGTVARSGNFYQFDKEKA